MYEIKQYEPKIYLFWKQEAYYDDINLTSKIIRTEYKSFTELFDSINNYYLREHIGDYIGQLIGSKNIFTRSGLRYVPQIAEYAVHNEYGDIISRDDIIDKLVTYRYSKKLYAYYRHSPFTFRKGSVPGIHCYRGGGGYHRSIHTTSERRANIYLDNDPEAKKYNIRIRGKRRGHMLPNSWDDVGRSDYNNRNWKHYRKHQWKSK